MLPIWLSSHIIRSFNQSTPSVEPSLNRMSNTPTMDRFLDSPGGLRLAASVARSTPRQLGYPIARMAGFWISSRRSSAAVQAVRTNQWVVGGMQASQEELDQAVRAVFRNSALSIYELHHYIQDTEKANSLFYLEDSLKELIKRPAFDKRGVVAVGMHFRSFDLAFQMIASKIDRHLAITIPNPQGGRQLEYEIRQRTNMNIVPGTMQGLRQALNHLKQGGGVLTGIDHPQPGLHLRPRFFGQPSALPSHYVYLALKAQVPIVFLLSRLEADGMYHVSALPPFEVEPNPEPSQALQVNTEKILSIAETFIRQAPHQWVMSHPVWPDLVSHVPK
jgi:phosphatidylinositol dimannoside acyltransferase